MAAIDPGTGATVTKDADELANDALAQLWTNNEPDWKDNLHADIRNSRDAMNGLSQFEIPDDFDVENKEQLTVNLPQKRTVPLKTVNLLGRRRPRIRRFASGSTHTPRARSVSSNVETWANAVCDKAIDWGKLVGMTFLEGACAVAALPTTAHWEKTPDYLDTIDAKKYKRLPKTSQAGYRAIEGSDLTVDGEKKAPRYERVDESGRVLPKRAYQRDKAGLAKDDPHYTRAPKKGRKRPVFTLDRKQSRRAYEKDRSAYLAHRLPFRVRIFSPIDAIPIFGADEELRGLICREEFAEEPLLEQGFIWGKGPMLQKKTDSEPIVLYTFFGYSRGRKPYVQYAVEGATYTRFENDDGTEIPARIDLEDECGMRELPVKWVWGLHLDTGDVTKKAIPFLTPTLSALTTAEAFLTFKAIHAYKHAFVSWAVDVNPEVARVRPELVITKGGQPREVDIRPNKVLAFPGKVTALVPPNVGNDANDIIRTLLQTADSQSPSELASGGGSAASGHDRSLSRDYLETSMNQVMSGALAAYKFICERILEAACWISAEYDVLVPVYANVKVPQDKGGPGKKQSVNQIVELNPDWIGEIFDVEAYYPKAGAEDIAMITILAQLYKEGLLTFYEFRERALGDESPEDSQIALWIDQNLKTPEGKQVIADRTREKYGAAMDKEMKRLVDRGLMSPNGTPLVSMLPPSRPRPPGGPADGQARPNTGPPAVIQNPPGAPQPAPIPGSPNQSPMIGSPMSNSLANQTAGGIVAGEMEKAATLNDAIARAQAGLGIGEMNAA